jgi:ABC-type transport system substrate-binding protein
MSFERFDDYYYQPANGLPEDKRVNFQALDLHLVPEESTRVAALRSGEADIVPASLPAKGQIEAGGGRLVFGPEGIFLWVMLLGCYEEQYPCHNIYRSGKPWIMQ